MNNFLMLCIIFTWILQYAVGYYIKPKTEETKHLRDEWSVFQQKLGLSQCRVEQLKSNKKWLYTMDLCNHIIEENSKYLIMNGKKESKQKGTYSFGNVCGLLTETLKLSKQMLKTSLKFELNDDEKKTTKYLKRFRRKIAVRMVSDIPTEKIDELLKIFNREHVIEDPDLDGNIEELSEDYDEIDYSNLHNPFALTSSLNPDYMYENIYEDGQDAAASSKINTNSEFTFLQDLILKTNGNQWQ